MKKNNFSDFTISEYKLFCESIAKIMYDSIKNLFEYSGKENIDRSYAFYVYISALSILESEMKDVGINNVNFNTIHSKED